MAPAVRKLSWLLIISIAGGSTVLLLLILAVTLYILHRAKK
jgi:hypothetical protein